MYTGISQKIFYIFVYSITFNKASAAELDQVHRDVICYIPAPVPQLWRPNTGTIQKFEFVFKKNIFIHELGQNRSRHQDKKFPEPELYNFGPATLEKTVIFEEEKRYNI